MSCIGLGLIELSVQAAFADDDGGSSLPRSHSRNVPREMSPIAIFAPINNITANPSIAPVMPRSTKRNAESARAAMPKVNAQ
jgi:hypothetical protein